MGKWSKKCSSDFSRCIPTQQRSRERYQAILETAVDIINEKGVDGLRMSDIVERAKIPHGSLYQYFPDKAAVIGTLAELLNEEGLDYVKAELEPVHRPEDLYPALCRVTDCYYEAFLNEPVMRDIWHATQTDPGLQDLDKTHLEVVSGYLLEALQRFKPDANERELLEYSRLIMLLIAAAVRYAITLEKDEGTRTLAIFKDLLQNREWV